MHRFVSVSVCEVRVDKCDVGRVMCDKSARWHAAIIMITIMIMMIVIIINVIIGIIMKWQ
jgi:hypothetical protein